MYGKSLPSSKRAVWKLRIDDTRMTPLKFIPWRSCMWLTRLAARVVP